MNARNTGSGGAELKGGDLKPLSEILARYVEETGLEKSLARLGALEEWAGAVGGRVSAVTRPVEVRGDTLIVEVLSSAWHNELSMARELILERVNACREGPPIGNIRFRLAEGPESLSRSAGQIHDLR